MGLFEDIEGFDWDEGNLDKNWESHRVLNTEAEQVFLNQPLLVSLDEQHATGTESRYRVLGQTDHGRRLFVVFTIRKRLIRIISARDMSKRERRVYDEKA